MIRLSVIVLEVYQTLNVVQSFRRDNLQQTACLPAYFTISRRGFDVGYFTSMWPNGANICPPGGSIDLGDGLRHDLHFIR